MRSRFLILIGLAAIAAVWVVVRTLPLRPSPFGEIPDQLVGRWTTTDARFVGRSIVLTPGTVSFGPGNGIALAQRVLEVQREADPEIGVVVYTIRYLSPDGIDEEIVILRDFQGALRIQHRLSTAWHRDLRRREANE